MVRTSSHSVISCVNDASDRLAVARGSFVLEAAVKDVAGEFGGEIEFVVD